MKRKLKVSGAELGKGKDVELWDIAGQFADLTAIDMDFIISKGLTYIGYRQTIYPKIDEEVTGKIGTLYTGTGMWLRGAPGPYTYTVKTAPVGTKLDKHDGFNDDASTCYYQIIAKNAMDGGTMYITVTAADGQTCDIPVTIAAVSGGHEHTWVEEIKKIDYEHHGYPIRLAQALPLLLTKARSMQATSSIRAVTQSAKSAATSAIRTQSIILPLRPTSPTQLTRLP